MITDIDIKHFALFAGLGGGSKGLNRSKGQLGHLRGRSRCLGGVDNDPAAMRDFEKLTGSKGTVLDMFSREQYIAFHGCEPPVGWREAMPEDIRAAARGEFPNIIVLSAPCKGFSGLLSEKLSVTGKYQALNQLTLRGIWLALEAFKDDPPEFYAFENVPRIMKRGRHLLDQIIALFRAYGYEVAETTHDCGELGGLAQSRKRFLLMARYVAKVPNFLYEPEKKTLRPVGDILGRMPVPGNGAGGPMHRIPALQWKTWVRLAFVEPGSDWRSLNKLRIEDGKLADYLIVPENRNGGFLGVMKMEDTAGTVAGRSYPQNGNFSVADPRFEQSEKWTDGQAYGVRKWEEPTGTVTSKNIPGQGAYSVADPRHHGPAKHSNEFRIIRMDEAAKAVTGAHGSGQCVADPRNGLNNDSGKYKVTRYKDPSGTVISGDDHGAYAVADPRPDWENRYGNLSVCKYEEASGTVIAGGKGVQGGWLSVADPRILHRKKGDNYLTGGHYGVVRFDESSGAVSAAASHDNGRWSVADPRMPEPSDKMVCVIRSLHDTWNRPFTTLELAALQSLIEPEEFLELDGLSDSAHRERIGNAIPPKAFEEVGNVMIQAILGARMGHTFMLSNTPIWVRNVAIAMSVKHGDLA